MEILQLKYFCDAAETQNFTKTADKFLVPTSNISQTIKRLEKELGTVLFERRANKIKLNDSGLLFYKNAKAALELLESAKMTLTNSCSTNTIKINIQICRYVVMDAIEDFKKLYPEFSFIISHSSKEVSNDFDIVITDRELELPYSKVEVCEENFLLAYNKNYYSFDPNANASELKNFPFITMSNGSSIYNATKLFCNQLGFSPQIALQSEDPFYVRQCVELGLGISLAPELSWAKQFSQNITLYSIKEIKRKIYVYKKYDMNKHINDFLNLLTEKFSS